MTFPKQSLFKGKKVALITHKGADIDAVSSCASLYFFLKPVASKIKILIPEHINSEAKQLLSKYKLSYEMKFNPKEFDVLFLLDFNSLGMIADFASTVSLFDGEKFHIDHHTKIDENLALKQNSFIVQEAVSTTEIIFEQFKLIKFNPSSIIAEFLAFGLISDSGHFIHADKKVFSLMAELLSLTKKSYSDLTSMLKLEREPGKKIALLKAAKRVRIFKIKDYIVATTKINAYEADAATSFLKLGADIAFAGSQEKPLSKIIVSSRATRQVIKKENFDLSKDVIHKLTDSFEGFGGGHDGAAAFNSKNTELEKVLDKCIQLTAKKFKANPKEYK